MSTALKIARLVLSCCVAGWLQASAAVPAPATGDIVYSARYYKPGAEASHYHLWRINPDGSGRVQVTSGTAEDHSPVWLSDGHTLAFIRQTESLHQWCLVDQQGGAVTVLASNVFVGNHAPDRRSVLHSAFGPKPQLSLFDFATRKARLLGPGWNGTFSPDNRKVYVFEYNESTASAILDLVTGKRVILDPTLRAGAWLDANTLVAEQFQNEPGQPRLWMVRADGNKEREVPLPFSWQDDLSPFADALFAIPGDPESILYGRHAGNSSSGAAQKFYRVNLKTGKVVAFAEGRDLAWSPDKRSFCTGSGRDLAPLGKRGHVWVSTLSVVSLQDGNTRKIVQGLVSVGDFDWR